MAVSKSWWYSFLAAYKALCMVNANVGSNAYTGTVVPPSLVIYMKSLIGGFSIPQLNYMKSQGSRLITSNKTNRV